MPISEQLNHPFFFIENLTPNDFFSDENRYYLGEEKTEPWKNGEEGIKQIIHEWQEMRPDVTRLFQVRKNNETKPLMVKGISLFIRLLFWSNGVPSNLIDLKEKMEMLEIKPVNIQDRLQFLFLRPTLHHSFIQLSELMVEQEKMFYKYLVMKKRVNHL